METIDRSAFLTVFANPDGTIYVAKMLPRKPRAKTPLPPPPKKVYRIRSLLDHPNTPFRNAVITVNGHIIDANGSDLVRMHIPAHIPLPQGLCVCTTYNYDVADHIGADPVRHHLHVFDEILVMFLDSRDNNTAELVSASSHPCKLAI